MPRTIRYLSVAERIAARLGRDDFSPGQLLPAESALASQYRVSRVTIRKALGHLKLRGMVESRQGFGWYAVGPRVRQTLDNLQTIEAQITAAGRRSERRILGFALVTAPPDIAALLAAPTVLRVDRVNLIDGRPFALVTVWVPDRLARDLSVAAVEKTSLYDLLSLPLAGASQVIGACAASEEDASLLAMPAGSPLLRCERTTVDVSGRPVLFSESVYNPLVTEFVAELPAAAGGETSGLRLVR